MARLLLTGSAGLIGRALRRVLVTAGHQVVGFDNAVPPSHPDYGDVLAGECDLPPIQFATGEPTTLGDLARHVHRLGSGRVRMIEEPTVGGTVARFWGDPARARALLGWQATVTLEEGLKAMIDGIAVPVDHLLVA